MTSGMHHKTILRTQYHVIQLVITGKCIYACEYMLKLQTYAEPLSPLLGPQGCVPLPSARRWPAPSAGQTLLSDLE